MVSAGLVSIAFAGEDHLPQLAALAKRYGDRVPDLADLCLIRMSELFPRHSVITSTGPILSILSQQARSNPAHQSAGIIGSAPLASENPK